MTPPLYLDLTDYVNANRWRWVLYDAQQAFVADPQVTLDPASSEANGFAPTKMPCPPGKVASRRDLCRHPLPVGPRHRLLIFLTRLEAVDRVVGIVEANWEDWLEWVGNSPPPNRSAALRQAQGAGAQTLANLVESANAQAAGAQISANLVESANAQAAGGELVEPPTDFPAALPHLIAYGRLQANATLGDAADVERP